jgi:hypothetical protein
MRWLLFLDQLTALPGDSYLARTSRTNLALWYKLAATGELFKTDEHVAQVQVLDEIEIDGNEIHVSPLSEWDWDARCARACARPPARPFVCPPARPRGVHVTPPAPPHQDQRRRHLPHAEHWP